jgi:hypothetical protein
MEGWGLFVDKSHVSDRDPNLVANPPKYSTFLLQSLMSTTNDLFRRALQAANKAYQQPTADDDTQVRLPLEDSRS